MSSFVTLLSPILLSWKNDFWRRKTRWMRSLILGCLGLGLWAATYWIVRRVLIYFQTVYELGPALAYQLLLIILLTFLSMLLFSNLVTSLSTFFLARDLDLVLSTPIPIGSFYYSRLITTTVNSSWMVLFFSLPIFVAYGSVFGCGIPFYLWVLVPGPLRSWPGAFSIGRSNKGSFTPYSPAMRYFSLSLLPGSLAPFTSLDGPRRKNRGRAGGRANGSIVLWKG